MKNVCVYCGSRFGNQPQFEQAAKAMGSALAANDLNLVYGGSIVGLMGTIADEMVAKSRKVIGVMPAKLAEIEAVHAGISDLHIVETMHQRKQLMADNADGFIMMPGGFGTLEEFFEIMTWAQIGKHDLPCAIYNVGGYFDKLLEFIDYVLSCEFITPWHRERMIVASEPQILLDKMQSYYRAHNHKKSASKV